MRTQPLYELSLYCSGGRKFSIAGEFKDLEQAYCSWRDSTFDDSTKLEVLGVSHCARRVPVRLAVARDEIEGMRLEVL